jgi:hypothetical protein
MEFIAKLKAEIKAEVLAELRAELAAAMKAELVNELRNELIPKAAPKPAHKAPKAPKAPAKPDSDTVTFFKPSDWNTLESDDINYERFEAWFEANSGEYNHMRHAFNSLIKHEKYIKISNDGTVRTHLQTWRP